PEVYDNKAISSLEVASVSSSSEASVCASSTLIQLSSLLPTINLSNESYSLTPLNSSMLSPVATTALISPCVIRYCKSLVRNISELGTIIIPNFHAAQYTSSVQIALGIIF